MPPPASRPFGAQLKALRESAGFTQEELATVAGLSVQAVSALERGERRRPHFDTVRSLSMALELTAPIRDALFASARAPADALTVEQLDGTSLPIPLTELIGRDPDVAVLRRWLSDPTARLITLVGPGGVGKTRLALEVARTLEDEGVSRVVFVSLAIIRDPAFVASAIAEALGLVDVRAVDLPTRARLVCEHRPTTMVLDNFEHVAPAAPLVADLLVKARSLRCLITSRAPLRIRGEREYAVGPLALDTESVLRSAADLTRFPAARLFVDRVRDVSPDFQLTESNGPTIAAICQRVDALPLAIELAAPWMKLLSAEDLLRRLERDVLLRAPGHRDLPERQQTMNAAVAWSYQFLDAEERRAFRRFGALPGLFPIDAAAAVLREDVDAALRAAVSLMDKSLLVRSETSVLSTSPLYYMLETIRAYALLELTAADERDDAMEGVVQYCVANAALVAEGLVGPAQVEWLDRVREDLESYRAALAWLIERGRSTEAVHITWALHWFWVIRGHTIEGLRWYHDIANMPSIPASVEAQALVGVAAMRYTQGEVHRAREEATRARLLADSVGDVASIMQADLVLGHLEHAVGNVDATERHFTAGLEGFRAAGVAWGIGHLLTGLALVALARGDADQTDRLLAEATAALRDAGPWFLQLGWFIRAVLAVQRGNADQALAYVRTSLLRIRHIRDKFAFIYALVPLAAAAVLKGNDAWAARIIGAGDAVYKRTGAMVADQLARELLTRAEQGARERLGPQRWARAYAKGRTVSIDSLLEDIGRLIG